MIRTIIWTIAFVPLAATFVLMLMGGEYANWAMVTTFVAGPVFLIAAVIELLVFRKRGVLIGSSPSGNRLAYILGTIFLVGVVWNLYKFVVANS
jgi:hypothetical protein